MFNHTVIEAEQLLAMDLGGSSDPFCVISFGPQTYRTGVEHRTLAPKWNQVWVMKLRFSYLAGVPSAYPRAQQNLEIEYRCLWLGSSWFQWFHWSRWGGVPWFEFCGWTLSWFVAWAYFRETSIVWNVLQWCSWACRSVQVLCMFNSCLKISKHLRRHSGQRWRSSLMKIPMDLLVARSYRLCYRWWTQRLMKHK